MASKVWRSTVKAAANTWRSLYHTTSFNPQYNPTSGVSPIPSLHMRKLKHRERKQLAWGHTAPISEKLLSSVQHFLRSTPGCALGQAQGYLQGRRGMVRAMKEKVRASLVAQWLRIHLPMRGTRVRALVWEDPTCRGAARPVSHNYWACASGACAPQQERPRQWEARAPRWRVASARRNWRKPSHRNEDAAQPKINK